MMAGKVAMEELYANAGPVLRKMMLTFLGTSSGAGPTKTRNCTSTAITFNNRETWLVDCAEGTQRQMLRTQFHEGGRLRLYHSNVKKIFVTHMHVDHVMGIVPLMNRVMPGFHTPKDEVKLEIYGPAGLRSFIRNNLKSCQMNLSAKYTVDELLTAHDVRTACSEEHLHPNEAPGRDVISEDGGLWRGVTRGDTFPVEVDAGPLKHRIPCIGYAFTEQVERPPDIVEEDDTETRSPSSEPYRRKAVICGDCSDASGISEIAMYPSVLVHEATKVFIPDARSHPAPVKALLAESGKLRDGKLEPAKWTNGNEIFEALVIKELIEQCHRLIREDAIASGHSTPAMAGEFARSIGAHELYLNHISSRFQSEAHFKSKNIFEVEKQAEKTFMERAVVAHDLLSVEVFPVPPRRKPIPPESVLENMARILQNRAKSTPS